MVIAVLGANGKSGREFVKKALVEGYEVRAGVHGRYTFEKHERLHVFSCDATKKDEVELLLNNCDVVVSLLGHGKNSPPRVQTHAMQIVGAGMKRKSIKRIISLTGTGVRLPGDTPSYIDKLLNFIVAHIDPDRVNDGIEHVAELQSSDLDWTVIRVLKLTNGKHAGRVKLSKTGPSEIFTPRKRVAEAILQVIRSGDYICEAPVISGVTT